MTNMRNLVKQGYNSGKFYETYTRTKLDPLERAMFSEFFSRIKGNKILDFGCGNGIPYDRFLVNQGFNLTGIDISEKHILSARKKVNATFILGDFSEYKFKEKYDAIVSFFAIFHIPRTEHKSLLKKMHSLLKKNGLILITLGASDMKCDVENFVGSKMAWSSYSIEKNKKLVEACGFEIIFSLDDNRYENERHLWILAKKIRCMSNT